MKTSFARVERRIAVIKLFELPMLFVEVVFASVFLRNIHGGDGCGALDHLLNNKN